MSRRLREVLGGEPEVVVGSELRAGETEGQTKVVTVSKLTTYKRID